MFSRFGHYPGHLFHTILDYFELKYDPTDFKEKCNSLEEKQEEYINSSKSNFWFEEYSKFPKYMLDYVMFEGINDYDWLLDEIQVDRRWGLKEDMDHYNYEISEELWEVVKRIIEWNPEETK